MNPRTNMGASYTPPAERGRKADIQNRHVYKREGLELRFISTVLGGSPEAAVEEAARNMDSGPGKYVVIGSDFEDATQVFLTLKASR